MSGIIQKVKEAVVGTNTTDNTHTSTTGTSHTGPHQTKETAGPHRSDVANKVDPRVDSDRDGRSGLIPGSGGLNTGAGGFGSKQATNQGSLGTAGHKLDLTSDHGNTHRATGGGAYNYGSTNVGPHDSNLANKMDPRVDSDRDGRAGLGGTSGLTGTHHDTTSGLTGTHHSTTAGPHSSNLANKADPRVDSDRDGRSGLPGTHHTTTTAGPHSSNLANKADPRVDSDRDGRSGLGGTGMMGTGMMGTGMMGTHHNTTAGPHSSNLANKADPRVDSDRDGRSGLPGTHTTGVGATGLGNTHHNTSTNAGPHSSNIANKMDPRVDSDRDHRSHGLSGTSGHIGESGLAGSRGNTTAAGYGAHHGVPATGNTPVGAHNAPASSGVTGHYDNSSYGSTPHTSTNVGPHSSNMANKMDPRVDSDRDHHHHGGVSAIGVPGAHSNTHSSTTTAGPHSSNLANKLDPSVDSDRDHRGAHGTTHGLGPSAQGNTFGNTHNTHNTTAGPHSSNLANKADPRVDSDRDHRAAPGAHSGTGMVGGLPDASHHSTGPAPHTAGPHKSDLLNKLDPRVDSNLDGSKTFGGEKTFAAPGAHHQ